MKTLSAFTGLARQHRTVDVMRLATLSLEGPGTPKTLYLSDRSRLVRSVQIWEDWSGGISSGDTSEWKVPNHPAFSALSAASSKVFASTTAPAFDCLEVNNQVLPMDQWAEGVVGTWTPTGGVVKSLGLVLRSKTSTTFDASDPAQFYLFQLVYNGTSQFVKVSYFNGSTWVSIATTDPDVFPFAVGDRFRAHADGRVLQAYLNDTLIVDVDDISIVNPGVGSRYGFVGVQAASAGTASDTAWGMFRSGTLKQEYVGCVLDWGVIGDGLGTLDPRGSSPSIDLILHNQRPLGGKSRFSDLWNHGQNVDLTTTYDFSRARLSIYLVPVGGVLGSLVHPGDEVSIATGTIDDVVSMSEEKIVIRTNQEPLAIPDDSATSIPQCSTISDDTPGVLGPDDRPIFGTPTDAGSRDTTGDDHKPGRHGRNRSGGGSGPGGPTKKEPSFPSNVKDNVHGLTNCGPVDGNTRQGPFYFSCVATPFEDPLQRRWFFTRCYTDSDLRIAPPLQLFCSSLSITLWDQLTCAQGGPYASSPDQVPETGIGLP